MRGKNSTKSLMRLKRFIVKVTKCMRVLNQIKPITSEDCSNERPALVPKGHFTVLAGKGDGDHEKEQRFFVELKFLKSPSLLKLLREAEEEYGFHQEGALVVPCTPEHLHQVLLEDRYLYKF